MYWRRNGYFLPARRVGHLLLIPATVWCGVWGVGMAAEESEAVLEVEVEIAQPPAAAAVEEAAPDESAAHDKTHDTGKVTAVYAVDRDVAQERFAKEVKLKRIAGEYDPKSGRWRWTTLPSGTYDLVIETENGRYEGVDCRPRWDGDVELTKQDRQKIGELLKHMKTFSDERRFLHLDGHGEEAVAIVELMRIRPTHLKTAKPSVVWRVERWSYRFRGGAWVREDSPRVLRRYLVSRERFDTWHWNFLPALGGIDVDDENTTRLSVTLPAAFDAQRGRAGPEAPREEDLP